MWSVSLMCNKQECKALYSWLCKNDYHCHQERCQDPITEFYIDCKSKVFSMVGFIGNNNPPSSFMDTQHHVLCKGLTQIIGVIQTIQGMPKYDCAASSELANPDYVDFLLENAPQAVEKAANTYATMVQNIPVSMDLKREPLWELGRTTPIPLMVDNWEIRINNHDNALHDINNMQIIEKESDYWGKYYFKILP